MGGMGGRRMGGGGGPGMFSSRPSPYDRDSRYGGNSGRFGGARGARSFKGNKHSRSIHIQHSVHFSVSPGISAT